MKKIYIILSFIAGAGLFLGSCSDHLKSDHLFKDRMSLEDVFMSEDYTREWLAGAYRFLENGVLADVSSKGYSPFSFADDMYFGDREDVYKIWKNGEYGEDGLWGLGGKVWGSCYQGIRQASILLQNIDMNKEMSAKELSESKAEAHFLRGYFYWKLLRLFGPIPLAPDEGFDYMKDYDALATPRSSYDECVEYINNEFLLAAEALPLRQDLLNVARPTRGAALAMRARLLLYAASPLMNGKGTEVTNEIKDDTGRNLMPDAYDESKWARAAAAAKDVMDLGAYDLYTVNFKTSGSEEFPATITPPYDSQFSDRNWPDGWKDRDPFESYRSLFNGTIGANDNIELIFTRGQNQSSEGINTMVVHQLPIVGDGWNTHGLTQKQIDAYYMNDGTDAPGKDKEIGRGDGSNRRQGYVTQADYDAGLYRPLREGVSLQYAEREPRFYASVAYNGSFWFLLNEDREEDKRKQVFYYRGSGNGYTNTMFWLRTGIGVMKFVHPDDTYRGRNEHALNNKVRRKVETNIRYAEVLLTYAEALNELNGTYSISSWDGTKTHAISRNIAEMKKGIHPVRIRGGVPDYVSTIYDNQNELRKSLKRERQIEFMGEGHRYYDLRRWMDAPVEESQPIYGCNVYATRDQRDLFHTPVAVPSLPTTFSRKMWFWPIDHSELRRNKRLTQNPGWTNPD